MDGIELMAAAMRASKMRLDVSAGNLANLSSDGFRRSLARVSLSPQGLPQTAIEPDAAAGPLRHTGRAFDLAVAGNGAFLVRDAQGRIEPLRSASFARASDGTLHDEVGRVLLGSSGVLHVDVSATFDPDGAVRGAAGRRQGRLALQPGTAVQSGFREAANVNAVREMVDVLAAQRAFETAEQTLCAIDKTREKAVNDVVRVKA